MPTYTRVIIPTTAGVGKALRVAFPGLGNPIIPSDWYLPEYDDSAWGAPVVANTPSGGWPPPSPWPPSGTYDGTAAWGDPLWTSASESDPNVIMLLRFPFVVPAGDLVEALHVADDPLSSASHNATFFEQYDADTADPAAPGYSYTGFINGFTGAGAFFVFPEHLIVGATNLLAIAASMQPFTRPALTYGVWFSIRIQLTYRSRSGRSSVQWVG